MFQAKAKIAEKLAKADLNAMTNAEYKRTIRKAQNLVKWTGNKALETGFDAWAVDSLRQWAYQLLTMLLTYNTDAVRDVAATAFRERLVSLSRYRVENAH